MKHCKRIIAAIISILTIVGLHVAPASAASDSAIVVFDGKAIVGNGTPGIAIVASYDASGKLTKVKKAPVEKDGVAKLDVATGDKVMYWSNDAMVKPLATAVTVTDVTSDKDKNAAYEKAVQNALCEALGKNKGKDMTDLQKALALHDWLVVNCQYDVTTRRTYTHTAYGAIVEGYAVCDGYTKAYNDLLGRVGVKATSVIGLKPPKPGALHQLHAWSCVTVGGKKYHVDVTSDDSIPDTPGTVKRTYFLVSDDVLNKADYKDYSTHCTDKTYENYDMFNGFYMQFIWDEDIQKFYYIDIDKVKTTSDFTEEISSSTSATGPKATSCFKTDDGKYICFFRPAYETSKSTVYLYSFETGEYYTYTVKDIENVVFCRIRQNGNNVEVVRDYYKDNMPYGVGIKATIPLPANDKKRTVTFDPNYSGAKATSCEYLNNYWTNGDESFAELKRDKFSFDGWYTAKGSGTKVENLDDITGDNATLYAHWWGKWKMTKEPTKTESGKAVRSLDGYPNVTEEKEIPNLSDTSVWTKVYTKEPEAGIDGCEIYKSEYGTVQITLPMKDYEYDITYNSKDGCVYVTVPEYATYKVKYEWGDNVEYWQVRTGPGKYKVQPRSFTPSGNVKATLCDIDENPICSVEYVAN